MGLGSSPDSAGLTVIIGACIAASWIITFITGSCAHWPFVLAGIVVGLWAAASINK